MPSKVLEVSFRGKDDNLLSTMKQEGVTAEQTARKIKELNNAKQPSGDEGEGKSGLAGINEQLGSRRALARLVQGGIAGFIGNELASATEKAKELSAEFRRGQIDATGLVVKIGEGLPIIGGFITAGQNIRELFTHEQEQIDQTNERIKLQNELFEFQKQRIEAVKKAHDDAQESAKKYQQEVGGLGLQGATKATYDAQVSAQNDVDQQVKRRNQALEQAEKTHQKALEDLRAQQADPKRSLPESEYQDKIKQIQSAAAKERTDITKEYQTSITAASDAGYAKQLQVQKDAEDKAWKIVGEHQQATHELEMQGWEARLKANDQGFTAELAQLQDQAAQKKKALQQQLQDQLKETPAGQQDALKRTVAAQMQAIDAATKAQSDALAKSRQDEIKKQLIKSSEDALKVQTETAKTFSAQIKAKQNEESFTLQAQLLEQEKALKQLVNDPTATAAEKKLAVQNLQAFVSASGNLFDKSVYGAGSASSFLASNQETIGLSGVGAEAKERGAIDYAKQTAQKSAEGVDVQRQMLNQFTDFLTQIRPLINNATASGTASSLFDTN